MSVPDSASPARVVIYFCELCHLRSPAEKIAAAVQERLGLPAAVQDAFWGTFKIEVDGQEVYNRWKAGGWLARIGFGRLPTVEEAVAAVQRRIQAKSPAGGSPNR